MTEGVEVGRDGPSLHPNNHRISDGGLRLMEFLNYRRFPPVYVADDGEEKHENPMCPRIRGRPYRAMCREEALYVYGERWCDTCRFHRRRVDFPDAEEAGA